MPLSQEPRSAIVFLVGMPGCGKSTVGKALAGRLQFTFLDLDFLIEQREGLSVAQLFEQRGQAFFREAEAAALRSVTAAQGGVVLATGGGAPCFHGNMTYMVESGVAVYLKVSPQELAARFTAHDLQVRPLLRDKTPEELLQYLSHTLAQREPFYRQALLEIVVNERTVEEVTAVLQRQIMPFL
ncbi:AAA family ATPase [Rufibacter immobilis]|uniref:Shikimate kinase n=1 Tax=Rufibacter immobilis TaxID=1348778 RepID=A0A3M9MX34_9BACT|nr:shikimate kinase [Rufibacter immobilis]RNI30089.1 AAA family ATPase [Rufibacter immobilis]